MTDTTHLDTAGERLDIATPDGVADAYVTAPTTGGPYPGVVVFMDAFGLRPVLEQLADRIAARGNVVLVPNVFHRERRSPIVDDFAQLQAEDRSALYAHVMPLVHGYTPVHAQRDTGAWLDYLSGRNDVADVPAAVTGYCMGGRLSLRAAGNFPDRVGAAASFHGGGLATDDVDSPHLGVAHARAELYFGHADHDPSMPPEQVERLEEALDAAGLRYRSEIYLGASHGYVMADTPAYDETASERHFDELFALLDRAR